MVGSRSHTLGLHVNYYLTLVITSLLLLLQHTAAIEWIGITHHSIMLNRDNITKIPRRSELMQYGLTKKQFKMIRNDPGILNTLHTTSASVVEACESAFNQSRWNCSSIRKLPESTPELQQGTREQAFVYALSSSLLASSIARSCALGQIRFCGCSKTRKDVPPAPDASLPADYQWSDCSINLKYGIKFAERFTDGNLRKFKNVNIKLIADRKQQRKAHVAQMNLHNNEIGRNIVINSIKTKCKCHGFSGACTVRTCWQDLDTSRLLIALEDQYKGAQLTADNNLIETKSSNQPGKRALSNEILIFRASSSDYCNPDMKRGSDGTKNRVCGDDYKNNCDWMCCGRGHTVIRYTKADRCNCKHVWCCYVKCDICNTLVSEYRCK